MTAELIDLARAGDGDAFRELVKPDERELHVHCYRIPGSSRTPRTRCCVLGFTASEAAQILDVSEESATSALKRARATMRSGLLVTNQCGTRACPRGCRAGGE